MLMLIPTEAYEIFKQYRNLNTSHVNVNQHILKDIIQYLEDLNTSHVNVNRLNTQKFIKNNRI